MFVDDCFAKVSNKENSTLEEEVIKFMDTMEDYAAANKLALNPDKTKVTVLSRNKEKKEKFLIKLKGKEIKHSPEVKILGMMILDDLIWECHLTTNLIPQIKNQVRSFRIISKYLGPKFRKIYANAIYRSKLLYGIESWGSRQKVSISKLQAQQDIMAKLTLGKEGLCLSPRQRQRLLNWLPISQEVELATAKTTFNIILEQRPEELASLMPQNTKGL